MWMFQKTSWTATTELTGHYNKELLMQYYM